MAKLLDDTSRPLLARAKRCLLLFVVTMLAGTSVALYMELYREYSEDDEWPVKVEHKQAWWNVLPGGESANRVEGRIGACSAAVTHSHATPAR